MKNFFCGPESFSPDLGPILGEAPELRDYFVAAGLNSIGILTGGGVGRVSHCTTVALVGKDICENLFFPPIVVMFCALLMDTANGSLDQDRRT